MAFESWATVPITGRFTYADGKPCRGAIVFELSQPGLVIDGSIVVLRKLIVRLDNTGAIPDGYRLYATDDPDLNITGWVWRVTEAFSGGRASYYLEVPHNAESINLATAVPVAPPPEMMSALSAAILANPEIFAGAGGGGSSITERTIWNAYDVGTRGEVCWDSDWLYVCIDTNTWKRTRIDSWTPPKEL